MITVNTYWVTERAVNHGVNLALADLLKEPDVFSRPEEVVDRIAQGVLAELTNVFDFGIQPIRLTREITAQLAQLAQEQPTQQ